MTSYCRPTGAATACLMLLIHLEFASGFVSTSRSATASFWHDADAGSRIDHLPDPPSAERLKLIQDKPYRGGFEPAIDVEHPYEPKLVYGKIPPDLVGSLASNGAGRIRVSDTQYGHWFDGDGYVTMISLNGKKNKAVFHGRYIRTGRFRAQQKLMDELRRNHAEADEHDLASPPLAFSGAWTKKGRGKWYENVGVFPTSPANTATMWLENTSASESGNGSEAPKLYALCEGGHPIQLDPDTLEVLQDERPFSSSDGSSKVGSFFSAHFKRCPTTGDIYNHGFCIRPGPLPKELNVMKLSTDGNLLHQRKSPLPFDCLTHDSALCSNHILFFLPPYYIPPKKVFSLISGSASLGNMLEWHGQDDKAYVQVVSRDNLKLKWRVELPEVTSLFHTVDAYEEEPDEDGSIILKVRIAEHDSMDRERLEAQFSDQYQVNEKRINAILKEFTFRLDGNGEGRLIDKRNVAEDAVLCEFPAVNILYQPGKRRRYIWTNALSHPEGDWLDGIQKVDAETGTASEVVTFGPGTFAGPPTFVSGQSTAVEDDGYILTTVYISEEHRSDFVILDASSLQVLCRMKLSHHVPFQFHGEFVSSYIRAEAI